MKNNKLILILIILLVPAIVYSETATLVNLEDDNSKSGIIFETNQLTGLDDSDFFFIGIEDKQEGFDNVFLYADNLQGKIDLKQDDKECSEIEEYQFKKAVVKVDNEYCLITKDGSNYVQIKILELAEDWSSVKFDWELKGKREVQESNEEQPQEEPQEQSKEEKPKKEKTPINTSTYYTISIISLIIILMGIFIFIEIKLT